MNKNADKIKCSLADYHAYPAVGSTLLRVLIQKTPAHYKYALENPSKDTPAKLFGSAMHEACLEPKIFKNNFLVEPIFEGFTKDGKPTTSANAEDVKKKKALWHMANHGKTIITSEQYADIQGMLNSIGGHKTAAKLMAQGRAEESLFWTDPETNIPCKARPDFIRDGHILVDLKTTEDASYQSFQKDIANYGYHIQAAIYLDGATAVFGGNFDTFMIMAVEKSAPYAVQCFQLDEYTIQEGRELYQSALKTLLKCTVTERYPGYSEEITPLAIPSWAMKGNNQ